ncbi:MAG: tetratricopeptide repeat-containing sensor histidine kinase [Sediminibacterium sp.]|nr:tetratricopeptide repeat-containing sensor histidine kinase [Sediminibacterium sp.]
MSVIQKITYAFLLTSGLHLFFSCNEGRHARMNHEGYLDSFSQTADMNFYDSNRYQNRLDSVFHALKNPGVRDHWTRLQKKQAYHRIRAKNGASAMLYADSMVLLMEKYRDDKLYNDILIKTMLYKGDAYLMQNNYLHAFNWYHKVRELLLPETDPVIYSEYVNRLALANYHQGEYREAVKYFSMALPYLKKADSKRLNVFANFQGTLDNIGISYVKAGMFDSAANYFQQALKYITDHVPAFPEEKKFISICKAVVYGNLADVAIAKGNWSNAETLLKESIRINDNPDNAPVDAALCRIKLAKVYLHRSQFDQAEQVLKEAEEVNRLFAYEELLKGILQVRTKLASLQNNPAAAFEYLSRYEQVRDSVAALKVKATSPYVQQLLDNNEMEFRMKSLQKENKLKSGLLWVTAFAAVLALGIVGLVMFYFSRSKKNLAELTRLHQSLSLKNEAMQQSLAELDQSRRDNKKLLHVVAHDLRGPVNSIIAMADLLKSGLLSAEEQADLLTEIRQSGEKSKVLIKELLEDIHDSTALRNVGPVNMEDVLKYCVELYEHSMKQKRQTIVLNTFPAIVQGEKEKLWRVFSNLMSNAVKFSKEGDEIKVTMKRENGEVVIAFHDHGIGIPEKDQDKVFTSPDQVRQNGTSGEVSFGLGLTISRQIVGIHHGKMWFVSKEGKGTSFYVSLPAA